MPGANEFSRFAFGGSALVFDPTTWAANTVPRTNGFQTGVADPQPTNTVLRQTAFIAHCMAKVISDAELDALDNNNADVFVSRFLAALALLLRDSLGSTAGDIKLRASTDGSPGWIRCDGRTLLRADQPALFTAIGTTFGAPSATEFRLPDLRGVVPRGVDAGRGFDPGRDFGSYQPDQNAQHTHTGFTFTGSNSDNSDPGDFICTSTLQSNGSQTQTTASVGASGGDEVRVKNVALWFMIKT